MAATETKFSSGIKTKYSGTYRCWSCRYEKTLIKGKRLIACKCGGKEWNLIAYSGKIPENEKSIFDRIFG